MILNFNRISTRQNNVIAIDIEQLIIAGWTGRNAEAIEHHIDELGKLGIAPPSKTPLFYRVSAANLIQGATLAVLGSDTSGEVEPVIVAMKDGLWIGIGSDHTDRAAEAHGVALSKQLCGKPVGGNAWRFDEVEAHWDELIIRSWATIEEQRVLYQDSSVSELRTPRDLIQKYSGSDSLPAGTVMFCGTPKTIGDIRPATQYEMEIHDPVLNRSLQYSYAVTELPIVS